MTLEQARDFIKRQVEKGKFAEEMFYYMSDMQLMRFAMRIKAKKGEHEQLL